MIKEKKDNFISFEESLFGARIFHKHYIFNPFLASDKKLEPQSLFW